MVLMASEGGGEKLMVSIKPQRSRLPLKAGGVGGGTSRAAVTRLHERVNGHRGEAGPPSAARVKFMGG